MEDNSNKTLTRYVTDAQKLDDLAGRLQRALLDLAELGGRQLFELQRRATGRQLAFQYWQTPGQAVGQCQCAFQVEWTASLPTQLQLQGQGASAQLFGQVVRHLCGLNCQLQGVRSECYRQVAGQLAGEGHQSEVADAQRADSLRLFDRFWAEVS